MFNPEFLTSETDAISGNDLIKYLQEQSPDVLQRVARSASPEIQEIIRHNVQGLLGLLPVSSSKSRSKPAATTSLVCWPPR